MNIYDMLSTETVKSICEYFQGDSKDPDFPYCYKSHTPLVRVLEEKFGARDLDSIYPCSRWLLTNMALEQIFGMNKYNEFFSTILSTKFIRSEHKDWDAEKCSKAVARAHADINLFLSDDDYQLVKYGSNYRLIKIDSNLTEIGEGGFAKVFRIDGTNKVKKCLKEEFKIDRGIVSRFKGEFEICKSLEHITGIIIVVDYNEIDMSYTMDYHSEDLSNYIKNNFLNETHKKLLIYELLEIMRQVHIAGKIHRDLSPHNIFIEEGRPIIADFGLGKDFNKERSHQTYDTCSQGTLEYCDPRQFRSLALADEQSDIYSLGKLINFIMTKDPANYEHVYKVPCIIATYNDTNYRYKTIQLFIEALLKVDKDNENNNYIENSLNLIKQRKYDSSMDNYLLSITGLDLVYRMDDAGFYSVYIHLFDKPELDQPLFNVLSETYEEMRSNTLQFKYLDGFGIAMTSVLTNKITSPNLKMIASKIVEEIAVDINRWKVQAFFKDQYRLGHIENIYVAEYVHKLI